MAIKVCDAIMGSGKSSAAINMMNSNPDKKFIYITPFLDETERIKKACPELNFVQPRDDLSKYKFSKREHIRALINEGENISATHQLYLNFDDEIFSVVKEQRYTLIIDESLEVYNQYYSIDANEVQFYEKIGCIFNDNGKIKPNLDRFPELIESNTLWSKYFKGEISGKNVCQRANNSLNFIQASVDKRFLQSFKDVYILTYLFKGQDFCYFLKLNNLKFEYINVFKSGNGEYIFSSDKRYIPEYTKDLHNLIEICEIRKLNKIGDMPKDKRAKKPFSVTTLRNYKSNTKPVIGAKSNLNSWFRYYNEDIPSEYRMWSTIQDQKCNFQDGGYIKSFVPFNCKATNNYSNKTCLAYLIDIYMNPFYKNPLIQNGIEVDEDIYALSIMVQWIWRSAIRNGEKIKIYIPSERMRNLLKKWITEVESDAKKGVMK